MSMPWECFCFDSAFGILCSAIVYAMACLNKSISCILSSSTYQSQISKEYRLLKFCYVPSTSATSSKAFLAFLKWPLTILMRQTRQVVCVINQYIINQMSIVPVISLSFFEVYEIDLQEVYLIDICGLTPTLWDTFLLWLFLIPLM